METYDILRTEMRTIQPIFKEDQVKMLKDKKTNTLLNFLQTPKTFIEIKEFYQNIDFEISVSNITKFLTELIEAGLIIEIGRRISRDNEKRMNINKLFSRSACIFNIRTNTQPLELCDKELLFLEKILYDGKGTAKSSNFTNINEQMKEIANKRNAIFEKLVTCSNDILNPRERNYDWTRIYTILDLSSWLIFFKNNRKLLENLFTLYD